MNRSWRKRKAQKPVWKTRRLTLAGAIRSGRTCSVIAIKDLRTNYEVGNTQGVLDGDLDDFIEASLKQGV